MDDILRVSEDTVRKSKDTKFQLHIWSRLLECRIAVQKVLVASRNPEEDDDQEGAAKSVQSLLGSLVKLRDTYRAKSSFNIGTEASIPVDEYSNINDAILSQRHNDYVKLRYDMIDKWYEKTKIGVIPKKGYISMELPTTQLIQNALRDKDRLLKRTRIDRTLQTSDDNGHEPEVFNDDDFYHQLLKEVISKDDNRRWAELQRLRGKIKRKADTKATKGRKIKKDILPKLVNFMAPVEFRDYPEQIRESIVKIPQPKLSDKKVGIWLGSICGLTATTVLLGGITRLTKSGLSMVDWHPFYEFPPKGDKWLEEFEKYRQYPEFKIRNSEITLNEFKWIWYMEYAHRSFGRIIGLSFFLPAVYFGAKGYFKGRTKHVISLLGGLILFQGGLGWYMVKSGLEEQPQYSTPRVSHLRLASHLGTAFLFHSACLLTALHHLLPPQVEKNAQHLLKYKKLAFGLSGAVFTTALSGALVAGLEAGLTYNSWPLMADRWIPTDLFAKSPVWKNFLQNSTTVQFDHRWLGQLTFLGTTGLWLYSRTLKLPHRARMASNLVMILACYQLSLGITTLLLYVPKELAAAHQTGALALLSSSLWLAHELKRVKK